MVRHVHECMAYQYARMRAEIGIYCQRLLRYQSTSFSGYEVADTSNLFESKLSSVYHRLSLITRWCTAEKQSAWENHIRESKKLTRVSRKKQILGTSQHEKYKNLDLRKVLRTCETMSAW